MKTFRIIFRFYINVFLANLLVTFSCLGLLKFYGLKSHKILSALVWYKLITIALILYLCFHYKMKELYYYQNLGITKTALIIYWTVFDLSLFFLLFIPTYCYL